MGTTVKLASKETARRDARFGIRRGQKDAKGQQSLESAATLTLGSMFLARFSTHLQRKIDLTNAFKSFFRDDSFKPCSKITGFLGKHGLGFLGGARALAHPCAREAKGHKAWNSLQTLKEPLRRSGGKSLAQGQVALIDPT